MAIALAGMNVKAVMLMFGGFIITIIAIAATIILSIIPTFTTDSSTQGYGEEYKCPAIMLKSIYVNSSESYINSSIVTNPALSTLSTAALTSISGKKKITGCVISSLYGYGPYNDSTTTAKRRRRATTVGLYSIGQMRCFFSTACTQQSDKGKYGNATSISNCIKDRLTATNSMFTKSGSLTQWTPVPSSFAYTIVNQAKTDFTALSVNKVYGVRPSNADAIASSFGIDMTTRDKLLAGCTYAGKLSQDSISAIIAAQYTETTTAPSSTQIG
ncbi:hypothetical protein I4U23_021038 [Adineta vaga]|nr:hypothetical protein I4U23_021038 [Adineta vaga]